MSNSSTIESNELVPAMAVFGAFAALPGALIGAAISGPLSNLLGIPIPLWLGLILGACIGASIGAFRAYLEFQRQLSLKRNSAFLGLRPLEGVYRGAIMGRIGRMLNKEVKFLSAHSVKNESAKVSVGDIQLANEVTRNGKKETASQSMHSYVYVEFSDVLFPHFDLVPESSFIKILDSLHEQDIDFEDSIDFSSLYFLKSDDSEKCRSLFAPDLRNHIARHKHWTISGDRNWLVFLRKRRFKTADDQKQYLTQCLEVADAFHQHATGQ